MVHYYEPANPWVLNRKTNLFEVFQSLQKTKLPVILVEDDNTVFGVLSSGDIGRFFSANQNVPIDKTKAEQIANTLPVMAHINDGYETIEAFLRREKIKILPLIDSNRKLTKVASDEEAFLNLNNKIVKCGGKPYLIAEIGVNHNGSIDEAFALIKAAAKSGCDAVKFQHRSDKLYNTNLLDSFDLGTQYIISQIDKTKLSIDDLKRCVEYSKDIDLDVIITPFDKFALDEISIFDDTLVAYKIASCDLTNIPLIKEVIQRGKSIIASTGMCFEREIIQTSDFLKKSWVNHAFLHCNSTYPCPVEDVNLAYINRLKEITNTVVGYSSHDGKEFVPQASVTFGAAIVEFHITKNHSLEGTDHLASIQVENLSKFVSNIYQIYEAIGNSAPRKPSQGEVANRLTLGKSLAFNRDLKKNHILTENDFVLISPGHGKNYNQRYKYIGKKLIKECSQFSYIKDELFQDEKKPFLFSELKIAYKKLRENGYITGIPVRYHDFNKFFEIFGPPMVEFHMSDRDISLDTKNYLKRSYKNVDLIVHAIEQYEDGFILDLASNDLKIVERSYREISRLIKHIDELRKFFKDTEKVPLVINIGGFSRKNFVNSNEKNEIFKRAIFAFKQISKLYPKYDFLPQTMPPFPWHQGGRSYHNLLVDKNNIMNFIDRTKCKICLDLSHTALASYYLEENFFDFLSDIAKDVRHIHLSDAIGNSQEGLDIGEGSIDFLKFHKRIYKKKKNIFLIPEIWQGHLNDGFKFANSIIKYSKIVSKKDGSYE